MKWQKHILIETEFKDRTSKLVFHHCLYEADEVHTSATPIEVMQHC